jgi:hypothetical protein
VASGVELTAGDVRLENRTAATVPEGAQSDLDAVIGATLAVPARSGEVLTDVRVLGPRQAESVADPDARIVPLPVADSATPPSRSSRARSQFRSSRARSQFRSSRARRQFRSSRARSLFALLHSSIPREASTGPRPRHAQHD